MRMHSTLLAAAKRPLELPGRAAEAKATLVQSSCNTAILPEVTRPAAETFGSGQLVLMIKAESRERPSDEESSLATPEGAGGVDTCPAAVPTARPLPGAARALAAIAGPGASFALPLDFGFPAVRTRRKITATRRSQLKSDGSGKPCCHSKRDGPVSTSSDRAGSRTRTTGPGSSSSAECPASAASAPGRKFERPPNAKVMVASPSSEREHTRSS
mmetsp:Transcript_41618/g.120519  ORF Transcript_41618/g.120519 Transcript_41618/m.120519 type:complete len:215 (+) Transcript_41618:1132-1776(+)